MASKYNVNNLEINAHALHMLTKLGIYDIRDLGKWRRHTFSGKKGVGTSILNEIESIMDDLDIEWRPLLDRPREELIATILNVLHYRDHRTSGDFYVGSMATAHVCKMINEPYGEHNFERGLLKASDEVVKKVYEYLQSYIDYMIEYPVTYCPYCTSNYREAQRNPDAFVVRFQNNYVQTLIYRIGLPAAKRRLLKEGTVALKLELSKLEQKE